MATMNQLMTVLLAADAAEAIDDAKRIVQIIANQQRGGRRDSALGYSVDLAQQMLGKGVEVGKRIAGSAIGEAATETAQEAVVVGTTAAQGGTISNDTLYEFIKRINGMADSDLRLQAKMVRPRVRGDEAQQQAAELD
jgi:hypothetical protein